MEERSLRRIIPKDLPKNANLVLFYCEDTIVVPEFGDSSNDDKRSGDYSGTI